ncbi:aminoglycoside phosphotransferase family protein [Blastococcus litoris]|uniref:aminoglycoside phosphotransferase family protein n=1 Tax=Blastococcus litoris TaxID=2171622 RepID=UPI000E307DEF|nr:aminoglycoside phosphotransferase family protein [Blastococcus litoris]
MRTGQGGTTGAATWRDPAWRAAALDWASAHLARAGLVPAGEVEQPHVRAWSTAFRLPVRGGGSVWLKAVGPGSAQEPVLAEALGRWVPDRVLVPLAVDPERRLVLLPDGGRTLRQSGPDLSSWARMLQAYADLQVRLVPHAEAMVHAGVPDCRAERLPDLVDDLLADDEALLAGRPDGLRAADRAAVRASSGRFADDCRRLDGGGVPATLQHDDLHDANVFADGGAYRFFDWGDASVAHPFLSLLVTLRMAARALDLPDGDPALRRLRDAYLEPWSSFGTPAQLLEQCGAALRVAPLARALSWRRILRGVHPGERAEWAASVPGWTAEHLRPGPLSAVPA